MDTDQHWPSGAVNGNITNTACLGGDSNVTGKQILRRHLPERDYQFWRECSDFAVEIASTVRSLCHSRVTVSRWPTPDTVGDAHVRPGESNIAQASVENVTTPTNERFAAFVFGFSRCLPNKQEVCICGTHTVDDAPPGVNEVGTALTVADAKVALAPTVCSMVVGPGVVHICQRVRSGQESGCCHDPHECHNPHAGRHDLYTVLHCTRDETGHTKWFRPATRRRESPNHRFCLRRFETDTANEDLLSVDRDWQA